MSDETPTPESPMSSENTALDILKGQIESLSKQLLESNSQRDEYRDALSEISSERTRSRARSHPPTPRPPGSPSSRARSATGPTTTSSPSWPRRRRPRPRRSSRSGDAQSLAGYKVEGDEIDDHALQAVVAKLKTEVDYAFDPEDNATTTAARDAARPTSRTKYGLDIGSAASRPAAAAPAATRAATAPSSPRKCADPKFMLDPRNKELITQAAKEGRFR